jgi:hypothetical protein
MNSSSPILCPLEERRSRAEILVKLFVVYFTTIMAFCHLMSVRGEPLLPLRPLFFVSSPFAFIPYLLLHSCIQDNTGQPLSDQLGSLSTEHDLLVCRCHLGNLRYLVLGNH